MDQALKNRFAALIEDGKKSSDEDTRKFAIAASVLLAIEGFGPAVFESFFEMLVERAEALNKVSEAMRAAAKEMGILPPQQSL